MQILTQHLRGHLGSEAREIFRSGEVAVLAWPDPDGDPDVRVLVTIGMSASSQAEPPPGLCLVSRPRTELFAVVPRDREHEVARVLADLATYPAREATWIHRFHNLSLGRPFVEGSSLSALVLEVPYLGAEFATLQHPTDRVDLLWVLPITASEHKYLKEHGYDAFSDLFEASNPDVTDFSRVSVVSARCA